MSSKRKGREVHFEKAPSSSGNRDYTRPRLSLPCLDPGSKLRVYTMAHRPAGLAAFRFY